MNKKEIINIMDSLLFNPSKSRGQNFLISDFYSKKIVNCINQNKKNFCLEIGPGFGALTEYLISMCSKLIVVEIDKKISCFLSNKYNNLSLINADVLTLDFNEIFDLNDEYNRVIISNLPYSVSSKIIIKILKSNFIDEAIIMIQKEVAARICANEKSRKYNNFSVICQVFSDVKTMFNVSANNFYPVPSVDSTVIKMVKKNKDNISFEKFEKFIQCCFSMPRKTIVNNLKKQYDIENIIKILNKFNISLESRSGNISVNEYINIYNEFKNG